jgi:chromosome segregation ATPase
VIGAALAIVRGFHPLVWVIVAALAWGGYQKVRAEHHAAAREKAAAQAAIEREEALHASIATTQRRIAAQQEALRHAQTQTTVARAAAASASAAADRLQLRIAAVQARARSSDPAASGPSPADQLADALGRCAGAYRHLADTADRSVIAGRACEAAYDSLTEKTP